MYGDVQCIMGNDHIPTPPLTRHTRLKTLPTHNFVGCDHKKIQTSCSITFFAVRNVIAARECFYTCLIVFTGCGLADTSLDSRHPTPRRRPLQRTVRILLECIILHLIFAPICR